MGIKEKLRIIAKQTLLVIMVALVLGGSFTLAHTALAFSKNNEKNKPMELGAAATEQPANKNNADPAETQKPADAPAATATAGKGLTPKTIPAGIIAADQAIALAKKGFQDFYGLDAQDCVVIDTFSNDLATVYGSGELYEPLLLSKAFAGKKMLLVLLHTEESDYGEPAQPGSIPVWSFQLIGDGADDGDIVAGLSLKAESGEVISGGLVKDMPQGGTYSEDTLKQMAAAARKFVEDKGILGQAAIAKVENMKSGPEVSVTLSDGRVIVVTVDKNLQIVNFYVKGVWDDREVEC
jgi:hypothetical protein